ncbi:ABC transporter permease [Actinocorallia populi]|uniref:ABC transporter permease n=1 Tax=Actinocorallia populi TaxID=2079200 RepID=UPI000D09294E|nr:ABC transporter permease [Actinocorallia populi]
MNSLTEVRLIAVRELDRLRSKMFVISTAVMMVLVAGLLIGLKLLGGSATKIGFVEEGFAGQVTAVATAMKLDVEKQTVPSQKEGERLVLEGELDALVLDGPLRMVVKGEPDEQLEAALSALGQQSALNAELVKAGADPAQVNQAVAGASVEVVSLEGSDEQRETRLGLAMALAVLLFIMLQTSGILVAQGVVEEKSSRVVELLLSSVRPWQLMAGKVLGLGLLGFLQMGLVVAAGVGAQLATGALDLPGGDLTGTVVWSLVWFVAGYTLYALLYAAVAATVSRQEDIGGVSAPIQILLMGGYFLCFTLVPADPDGTLVRILSFVPVFAPLLMPIRAVYGAPLWEQLASIGVTLVVIAALVWLAGRIYANSVLRTGGRVSLKEAMRAGD